MGLNETDNVDILVAHRSSLLSSIIDKHAPVKSIRVSERYCPWVDRNLKKLYQAAYNWLSISSIQAKVHSCKVTNRFQDGKAKINNNNNNTNTLCLEICPYSAKQ